MIAGKQRRPSVDQIRSLPMRWTTRFPAETRFRWRKRRRPSRTMPPTAERCRNGCSIEQEARACPVRALSTRPARGRPATAAGRPRARSTRCRSTCRARRRRKVNSFVRSASSCRRSASRFAIDLHYFLRAGCGNDIKKARKGCGNKVTWGSRV